MGLDMTEPVVTREPDSRPPTRRDSPVQCQLVPKIDCQPQHDDGLALPDSLNRKLTPRRPWAPPPTESNPGISEVADIVEAPKPAEAAERPAKTRPARNSVRKPDPAALAQRRNDKVACASCNKTVERQSRRQQFCSKKCCERARKRTRKAGLGTNTRAPANPPKFGNKINGLWPSKPRPYPGISAPAAVIHGELFAGRKWEPVTSEDGVTCLIARKAA